MNSRMFISTDPLYTMSQLLIFLENGLRQHMIVSANEAGLYFYPSDYTQNMKFFLWQARLFAEHQEATLTHEYFIDAFENKCLPIIDICRRYRSMSQCDVMYLIQVGELGAMYFRGEWRVYKKSQGLGKANRWYKKSLKHRKF